MKYLLSAIGLVACLAFVNAAQAAGNAEAGKAKAAPCAPCHGANGQGVPPNPPLKGIAEDKFIQDMKDYKSGKRANPVMKGFATPLSDQDIENLAAYYASLK
jgi:cytochrome c553